MNIFRLYREYLVNYNISIVALQSLKQNNSAFRQLVNVCKFILVKNIALTFLCCRNFKELK